MKKLNRQTLLIGGAAACLLIALMTLFLGSKGEPSSAPAPPSVNAYSDPSSASSSPSEEGTGDGASEPSALNPEFYQRVRRQLLAVTPAHQEPFVAQDQMALPVSSPNAASHAQSGGRSLPVLPIALQPSASMQVGLPGGASSSGGVIPSHPPGIPSEARNLGSPGTPPSDSATTPSPTNTPRLRGLIRDHANGKITVLFELNGALLRASNEPNAEWRIVRIEPRQITVRNGKQTLILEVPYAP